MSRKKVDTYKNHFILGDKIDQLQKKIPCRIGQISKLLSLFGQNIHLSVPSIFIYGHTCTGKTAVVKSIMEELELKYVIIDCVECFTTRLFYEQVLSQLSGNIPCAENDYATSIKCDNMNDFVSLLRHEIEDKGLNDQTVYLILHRAERLRDMDMNLLPALMKLQELSGLNICVILESEIVWEKFRSGTGCREPYVLHFPDYTKDELMEILSLDQADDSTEDLYRMYLNLVLSVFHTACRNLSELRHLAKLNFPKYIEPIKKGEAEENDYRKLWRNIEPHLKKALQTVYLREISSAQWEKYQSDSLEQSLQQGLTGRASVELPFYSKYLLIAAYLASYNPMTTDKRFFSKHKARISKRTNLADRKRNERTSAQLLGPKPFPLDRLMAIFYCIVDERVAPTANIFTQITSLVSLGLMSQVALSDQIESPKYKCLVSLDFIKSISRTVNFDIIRHLYDFV